MKKVQKKLDGFTNVVELNNYDKMMFKIRISPILEVLLKEYKYSSIQSWKEKNKYVCPKISEEQKKTLIAFLLQMQEALEVSNLPEDPFEKDFDLSKVTLQEVQD